MASRRSRADVSELPLAIYARLSLLRKPSKKRLEREKKRGRRWETITVERQTRICREWAEANKVPLWKDVFTDNNLSAWVPDRKRPQWDALNELLRTGQIGGVLVFDADRFCRKNFDLEVFIHIAEQFRGVQLASPTGVYDLDSPDSQDMLRMRIQMANREVAQTSKRVRAALEERARDGLPPGGARRYGFTDCDCIEKVPHEADVIREATKRILEKETMGSVLRDFEKRGIRTVNGKPFTSDSLPGTLLKPCNAGIVMWDGQPVARLEGDPILKEDDWRALVALFESRRRGRPWAGVNICAGRVWCGRCGHRMSGESGGKAARRMYRCKRRAGHYRENGCLLAIDAEALEADVTKGTIAWLSDPRRAKLVAQLAAVVDEQQTAALNALTTARTTLADLYHKRALGEITPEDFDRISPDVTTVINTRQAELDAIQTPAHVDAVSSAEALRTWNNAQPRERRELIHAAYKTITVNPHPSGRGTAFTTDRVMYDFN